MFKSKHVFTCPDVIHLRNRQKKMNKIAIAINVLFFGGLWAGGTIIEVRENRKLKTDADETPAES